MDGSVLVPIPVSPQAAELLRDHKRAERVGKWVSTMLADDALASAIAAAKAEAHANGLTDEIIDAELAAYNAERRF